MATEVVIASKTGINSTTTADSDWVNVFTQYLNRWTLYAKMHSTITKSGSVYKVASTFYIKVTDKVTPVKDYIEVSTGSSAKSGFDDLGSFQTSWTTKSASSISSSSQVLGSASTCNKDVSAYLTTNTTSGTLYYNINFSVYNAEPDYSTRVDSFIVQFRFDGTFYGTKVIKKYTLRFNNDNDRLIDSITENQDTTVRLLPAQTSTKTPSDTTSTVNYTISYDTRGGTPQPDNTNLSCTFVQHRKNVFDYWLARSNSAHWGASASYTITKDEQFNATYDAEPDGPATAKSYPKLGSNASKTVYKKGYNKTNSWFNSSNSPVDSSTEVTSSMTLHVEWDSPKDYKITFNLNGGKIPADAGKISDYTTTKTYSVNGPTIPTFIPTYVGYTFVGWGDQNGNYVQQPGEYINDNIYNSINNEQSNNGVIFYAKWVLKPNTVKFNYFYNEQDSDPSHDIHITNESAQFNITQTTFEYYAPEHTRTGDFVFLGWSDVVPTEWDKPEKANEGYHGVYNIPPQKIIDVHGVQSNIELPLKLDIKKFKTLEDWGNTYTYYGIWAKTGKYIRLGSEWKKVSNAYVRVNGEWKPVTGMWTYIDGEWKEEV